MVQKKRLLFEVSALKKNYGDNQALNIKRLEIHPGTVYGVTGSFGSGKTTLLNILSGKEKQTSGDVLYDDMPHESNWLGNLVPNEEIFYTKSLSNSISILNLIKTKFGKKRNIISVENNIEEKVLVEKINNEKLIAKYLENKKITKIIYVKNRIINYIIS